MIRLKQLAQDGASADEVIKWDGSKWTSGPGGGASDRTIIDSLTTTGLADGDFGYVSSADTVSKTDADTEASSEVFGCNEGTVGSMTVLGIVDAAKFTTDGGSPSNGDPVWLAPGSYDSSTGQGKVTASPPSSSGQFAVELGVCLDNSNYGTSKTCKILLNPKAPIAL